MGPKGENVEKALVLPLLFEGSRWPGAFSENERLCEPDRLGGGRGLGGLEGLAIVRSLHTPRGQMPRRIPAKIQRLRF